MPVSAHSEEFGRFEDERNDLENEEAMTVAS